MLRLDFATAERLVDRAQKLYESVGNRHKASFMLMSRATMWPGKAATRWR